MGNDTFTLTIDRTPHATKPQQNEIGKITYRLKTAGPETVTYDELESIILKGGTICCGCYEPTRYGTFGHNTFLGQQLFALDFDHPDVLDPMAALERCEAMGLPPFMMYFTFSATQDPWYPKFRLLFNGGELITDKDECERYAKRLVSLFPEADSKCTNLNRLYFGGQEAIRLDTVDWERGQC